MTRHLEIWLVDLDRSSRALEHCERSIPRLSAEEERRAVTVRDEVARTRWRASHIALRVLLERCAGPSVRSLAYVMPVGGRPELSGVALSFSLSHSGPAALIGIDSTGPVGVDLETPREVRASLARAYRLVEAGRAVASPACRVLEEGEALQAWTRLEALAKVTGRGMGALLERIGVRGQDPDIVPRAVALPRLHGVEVQDLALPHGLVGSIATAPPIPNLTVHGFPADPSAIERLAGGEALSAVDLGPGAGQ